MKHCNFFVAFIIVLTAIGSVRSQEVDVILIGGQSNATGQGYISNLPRSFEVDRSVMFYYSKYLNRGKGSEQWLPLCQASETDDKFGVELSLGTALQKYFPDRKIALIKHALSGSNLYSQWNPGNGETEAGEEYRKWLETVYQGLNKLKEKGFIPVIRAMVWQQGEGDAREIAGMENSRKYGENLRNLILRIREDLHAPGMLFVYGEVMPMAAERFPGRELVRKAQVLVAEDSRSQLSVKNAFWVEGDDLQMRRSDYHTPIPQDDVHLGTFGVLTLGERFAEVIFKNSGRIQKR